MSTRALIGDPPAHGGGTFRLARPAPGSFVESLAGGWRAELALGSRRLVIRAPTPVASYLAVLDDAMNAVQEALDLWSMRGDTNLVIEAAESQHVVWWTEGADIILQIVAVSDLGVAVSVRATATDAQGRDVPQPAPPAVQWHPSFRYFRLSQTTANLFDAIGTCTWRWSVYLPPSFRCASRRPENRPRVKAHGWNAA